MLLSPPTSVEQRHRVRPQHHGSSTYCIHRSWVWTADLTGHYLYSCLHLRRSSDKLPGLFALSHAVKASLRGTLSFIRVTNKFMSLCMIQSKPFPCKWHTRIVTSTKVIMISISGKKEKNVWSTNCWKNNEKPIKRQNFQTHRSSNCYFPQSRALVLPITQHKDSKVGYIWHIYWIRSLGLY